MYFLFECILQSVGPFIVRYRWKNGVFEKKIHNKYKDSDNPICRRETTFTTKTKINHKVEWESTIGVNVINKSKV